MFIETRQRQLKYRLKETVIGKLKVGKKTYRVNQVYNGWFEQPVEKHDYDAAWNLSVAQMRSILKNNADTIEIMHLRTFDGMIDCTREIEDREFSVPRKEWLERIIEQIGRRGLFNCYYSPRDKEFSLYSCVDDYKVRLPHEVRFL